MAKKAKNLAAAKEAYQRNKIMAMAKTASSRRKKMKEEEEWRKHENKSVIGIIYNQ